MNRYQIIADALMDDVMADGFFIGHAGQLCFTRSGSVFQAYAPGTWFRVTLRGHNDR